MDLADAGWSIVNIPITTAANALQLKGLLYSQTTLQSLLA